MARFRNRIDGHYLVFVCGFIRVVEGLAMLASLGFYYPHLEIELLCWNVKEER
jgi:hypothetical protein